MGNSKSKQNQMNVEIENRTNTKNTDKQDSDDTIGCCIKINKLSNKSSFTCCMQSGNKSNDTIIIGDKNKISTSVKNYK